MDFLVCFVCQSFLRGRVFFEGWLETIEKGHALLNCVCHQLVNFLNLLIAGFFLLLELLEVGRPDLQLFVQSLLDVFDGQLQQTEEKLIASGQQGKPVDLVLGVRVEVFELVLNSNQTRK